MKLSRMSGRLTRPYFVRAPCGRRARQRAPNSNTHDTLPASEDDLIDRIRDAEVVFNIRSSVKFTERVFAACPRLRLLSVWGTGTDHIDLASAARHGDRRSPTRPASRRSPSRNIRWRCSSRSRGGFRRSMPRLAPAVGRAANRSSYTGRPAGSSGSARSAAQFARIAAGFGMRVIAWTMHPKPGDPIVELDELYRASDVISMHLRLSPRPSASSARASSD